MKSGYPRVIDRASTVHPERLDCGGVDRETGRSYLSRNRVSGGRLRGEITGEPGGIIREKTVNSNLSQVFRQAIRAMVVDSVCEDGYSLCL